MPPFFFLVGFVLFEISIVVIFAKRRIFDGIQSIVQLSDECQIALKYAKNLEPPLITNEKIQSLPYFHANATQYLC